MRPQGGSVLPVSQYEGTGNQCFGLIDLYQSHDSIVLLSTHYVFICVLTGCDETLLRLHSAPLWTQMDRMNGVDLMTVGFTYIPTFKNLVINNITMYILCLFNSCCFLKMC